MPALLRKVRTAYEPALKKINDDATGKKEAAARKHLEDLEFLQKALTIGGDLEGALIAKAEKENFAASMTPSVALAAPKPAESAAPAPPPASAEPPPGNDAHAAGDAPAMLVGTWRFSFSKTGWSDTRTFKADGTFTTDGGKNVGSWKVAGDKVVVTYPDRVKDEMFLPLDPKGAKVIGKRGREYVAVKEKP